MSQIVFNEAEQLRRQAVQTLKDLGIDPYPAEEFTISTNSLEIKQNFDTEPERFESISIAGRIMSRRIMGNASFFEIMDGKGRIQCYVNRDAICDGEDKTFYNTVFKKLLDIGDIVGLQGYVFYTKTKELSVHVQGLTILTKSLKQLPIVKTDEEGNIFDAFSNPELRYRQRYVDLIVNSHVKETFIKRSQLIQTIRNFFNNRGYIEVETPILQPIYGGAAAKPFKTHHNTLDMDLYLRIANELYLKRLIVGGFEGVYEFAKNFRNEGMSRFHNPEFTGMEVYVAYKYYNWMIDRKAHV